jgi:hypothetical protein
MRNRFGGACYKCGLWVTPGTGHFELHKGKWRTQHALYEGRGAVTCKIAAQTVIKKEVINDPR